MVRYLKILLLLISSQVCQVDAQSLYNFKNFTISDGLSQSSALCMLQDKNYSLWIGTQDGLNRFNGKSFEVFNSDNTEGFKGNFIRAIEHDESGNLWIASDNGLIFRDFASEKFTSYNHPDFSFSIEDIKLSSDKQQIWMATSRKGIWVFDIETATFTSKNSIFTSNQTKHIFVSQEGLILVSSTDNQLEMYNPETGQIKNIDFRQENHKRLAVNCFYQYEKGSVYIGTNDGVFIGDLSIGTVRTGFENLQKKYINQDVSGILRNDQDWYITTFNNGFYTILEDGKIIHTQQDVFQLNGLLFNEINCIYKDVNEVLWLGTSRGVSGFSSTKDGFHGITSSSDNKHGLITSNVWSVKESVNKQHLFIGTDLGVSLFSKDLGGLIHFDRQKGSVFSQANNGAVIDIYEISQQKLLLACLNGIYELTFNKDNRFHYEALSFMPQAIKNKHQRFYNVEKYDDNRYFIATNNGVLLIDYQKKTVKEFIHDEKKANETILAGICRYIFKNSNGEIYFATSTGGLSVLNENNSEFVIKPYPYNKEIMKGLNSYISSMFEVGKGIYYIGTAGDGLIYWNVKTKERLIYTKKDGLPNNVIYSILMDSKNNLWLSSNRGITQFDLITKNIRNFTDKHGLLSNEFNMGEALRSSKGIMYFGCINGLVYFNPSSLGEFETGLDIKLSRLKIGNQLVLPYKDSLVLNQTLSRLQQLELNYSQRSFTVYFQTDNLYNSELINYKYHLEGSSENEIEIGGLNEIRFNSLSSGEYTLEIYARIGYSDWGEPKLLTIIIKPPFWKTWWFWTLFVVLILLIIRYTVQKRIQHERREQVRLEMKIAERTSEIREQNKKIEKQKGKLEVQRQQLEIEKEKSEKLLRNVIPESMADELLSKGSASARAFRTASVMFTDFVGFTKITNSMKPSDLVKKLDIFFRKFDEIIFNNNLERIKTIGDAYMAAGGVPVRNKTNPIDICLAGLQIIDYIKGVDHEDINGEKIAWSLRVGINTGEVTAGVIGAKRLAYDVWGSTVNYAQRMEMYGEPGKVSITKNTFECIQPYFVCTDKGMVTVKGDVQIQMFQIERIKPELSLDGNGIYPNDRFHKIVTLHHFSSINYYKAERFIMKKLTKELSPKLLYHSVDHLIDVVAAVEQIALREDVTDEGLFLLKTAANYHDAGFIEQYDKNEKNGARMASEILPKFGYTEEHINVIKELIYVTEVPHQPKNLLEKIICDADLDYLGRDDFDEISDKLRRELRAYGKINSDRLWDEMQVKFLTMHRYFTKTSIETRLPKKLMHLQKIKERLAKDDYID